MERDARGDRMRTVSAPGPAALLTGIDDAPPAPPPGWGSAPTPWPWAAQEDPSEETEAESQRDDQEV